MAPHSDTTGHPTAAAICIGPESGPNATAHSGKIAIDVNFFNAGGNNVVVDIGYGLYAFYAQMRPGTVTVKVGDEVTTGEILGHIGNRSNVLQRYRRAEAVH